MKDKHGLRVLIVEDDPTWQTLLSELVGDLGFHLDIADTLDEAETFLRDSSHRIAIVDLSLDMDNHRNTDGLQLLQMIQQHDPLCTPLILSGYATVEQAVKGIKEYGAYTCLHKENFTRSGFNETIREMLAQSGSITAHVPTAEDDRMIHPHIQPAEEGKDTDKNALVVEDDAGWRELLSELLYEENYSVQVSSSFGEAIGFLARKRYDLAVVDLSLVRFQRNIPSKDFEGYRLLENCYAKGITTIVVSGQGSPEEIEKTYEKYGIFAYLEKQAFERTTFLKTLQQLSESKQVDHTLEDLTDRERQVLGLLARGVTNKEIADKLIVSPNTVKRHIKAIYKKLGVHTRTAATVKAINAGIVVEN
jgi:DNA-binding NarL/FixJ family response regulator